MAEYKITVPELGLDEPVTVSVWLCKRGARVAAGEPLVELLCGPATFDVSVPVDGVLAKKLVDEDEEVAVGEAVGIVQCAE
jgi:pyruvate/2-oxoglutarate dehydrogenase complex dihydrolipoamide acyltransferase (E2) component